MTILVQDSPAETPFTHSRGVVFIHRDIMRHTMNQYCCPFSFQVNPQALNTGQAGRSARVHIAVTCSSSTATLSLIFSSCKQDPELVRTVFKCRSLGMLHCTHLIQLKDVEGLDLLQESIQNKCIHMCKCIHLFGQKVYYNII